MTTHLELAAESAPTALTVVLSGVGVDAAGNPATPPPGGQVVDAASRRQDQPAAPSNRLAGLAPASTLLPIVVLGYLNAALARHWRTTT